MRKPERGGTRFRPLPKRPSAKPCPPRRVRQRQRLGLRAVPLGLDNPGDPRIELGADPQFRTEHRDEFLGGVTVTRGAAADSRPLLAIPFYALANRDKSWQEVWLVQHGILADASQWEGRLYRPLRTSTCFEAGPPIFAANIRGVSDRCEKGLSASFFADPGGRVASRCLDRALAPHNLYLVCWAKPSLAIINRKRRPA